MHAGMRRRHVMTAGIGAMIGAGLLSDQADAASGDVMSLLRGVRLVNLSHLNDPATTSGFPGDPEFTLETPFTIPADGFYLQYVKEGEHTGTHWGAPGHMNEDQVL